MRYTQLPGFRDFLTLILLDPRITCMYIPIPLVFSLLFLILPYYSAAQSPEAKVDSILVEIGEQPNDSLLVTGIIGAWNKIKYSDPVLSRALIQRARALTENSPSAWAIDLLDYNEALIYYNEGNYEEASKLYKKSLAFWKSQGNTLNMLSRELNLIIIDFDLGRYTKVAQEADSLCLLAEELENLPTATMLRGIAGLAHNYSGNHLLAMQHFLKCVAYFEQAGDTARWADNLVYLAGTQLDLKKYTVAESYYKEAIKLYKILKDQQYLVQAYNDLSLSFIEKEQLDSAEYFLQEGLKIAEKHSFTIRSSLYSNLGKVSGLRNQPQQAENFYIQAIQLSEEQKNARMMIDLYTQYGDLLRETGRIEKAASILQKGESLALVTPYPEGRMNIYHSLAKYHELMGASRKSGTYWKQYAAVKDSLTEQESIRQQNELQIVYETEKKEKALLVQKQENAALMQAAEINQIRFRNLWIVSALILGIAILSFVIYRQKNIRKQILQDAEKKELEKELEFKQRELTTHTLHLVSKNKLLNELKSSIEGLSKENITQNSLQRLSSTIDHDLRGDEDWANFEKYFRQVHSDFDEKIKRAFSDLTGNEIRLITLMKMNLSSKEIAGILNITPDSVNKARYRLRKKLNLDKDQGLQQFILAL